MIKISGNTFKHRDLFKSLSGKWNAADKNWNFHFLTNDQFENLCSLVGVIVVDTSNPEVPMIDETNEKNTIDDIFDRVVETNEKNTIDDIFDRVVETNEKNTVHDIKTKMYGDDDNFFNYFKDKNPLAFFGFSSLFEFVNYIENIKSDVYNNPDRAQGWEKHNNGWAGTKSMKYALKLANTGWNEGIEKAEEIIEYISIEHSLNKKRSHSLAGGSVNVGRMLSGNPKHMISRKKLPAKKIITLFVESAMTSVIKPKNAIIRACLICAIADLLEQRGYSCEIVAVMMIDGVKRNAPGAQLTTVLKQSGEKLNLSDIAFTLGHPSFFRRMIFGALGSSIECKHFWDTMGIPTHAFNKFNNLKSNELYIKQLNFSDQSKINNHRLLKDKTLAMLPLIQPENLSFEIRND